MPTTEVRASSVVSNAMLDTPPFRRPVHKTHHVRSVFPGQPQKLPRIQIRPFLAKKRLKSPPQVRALPGIQPIPTRHIPVVPQGLEHRLTRAGVPVPKPFSKFQLPASGAEICSWTNSHPAGRFSQIPV